MRLWSSLRKKNAKAVDTQSTIITVFTHLSTNRGARLVVVDKRQSQRHASGRNNAPRAIRKLNWHYNCFVSSTFVLEPLLGLGTREENS